MDRRRVQLAVWLIAVPVLALVVGHVSFWALVDVTGTNNRREGVPLLVAVAGTAGCVIAVVSALARRAGKPRDVAVGWGLVSVGTAIGIYVLFAAAYLATHADSVG